MTSRPRLLLVLAFIAFISLGLPDGLLGVAWPSMRHTFALPIDALGSLFISTTIGYVTASFMSGAVLRFMRLGTLLALSCALTACALIAYSLAPAWELIVACGVLTGLGAGAIDSALNTFAAHNYSPRTVNMLHAFYGLGTTIGPALMTAVLLANEGWQRGYMIVGVAQLLLGAGFIGSRKLWPIESNAADPHAARTKLMTTLRLPATQLSVLVFILYCGLEASTGAWLFTLLHEGRGVGTATAGTAVSVFWGSLMAARIVFGLVPIHPPLSRALVICMSALSIATLTLTLTEHPLVSMAAGALIGFACGPIFPWLIAETPQRLGIEHGANAIGVQIASAAIGLTLAPAIIGVAADAAGVNSIPAGLFVIAVLLFAAFALLERVSRARA